MRGDIRDFLKRAALAYGLVVLLLLLTNAGAIAAGRFPDPDDALRLVELRDWLGGQGWFDVTQHRIDPAHGGVAMHWSRLVDVPLAMVVLALRPLLGGVGAEMAALLIVPMVTLAVVLVLVARVAWERLGAEAATLSCLTLAMSVPVVTQIRPMRIDHHGWQVAAAMLALQGLMTRHARIGGWISGAALAIGLSISLEGLPLTVVFGALGAWRWLRAGETKYWLAHFATGLAGASLACFAVTRWGDWAQHCDAIAPVHLAMFVWAAVVLRVWRGPALMGFAVTGAGALALYFGLAPQCRGGSFNMLDPLVQRLWYQQVAEGLPVWRQDWATALQTVVPPLFALFACVQLIRRSAGEERVWWQEYTLLLGGALGVALLVTRAGAVAGAFAAVPLAWLVGEWLSAARRGRPIAVLGIVAAMVPSAPITVWGMVPHKVSGPAAPSAQRVSACEARRHAAVLNALPQGTILAPLDIGPDLLLGSRDSVLATGHHRGARGMHDVIAAFVAAPDQARGIIRANHIAYVALCPDLGEPQIYAREAPQGLAAQLLAGRVPSWLVPAAARGDGLQVWRVL
ncbi:hypothetical protein FHW96_004040 [Novosphingobium sp. SG751A]|uniref:hypothetical protein n=1 Tax=Novosphingobium sp. SG751A TaxID=2587000 RepID=UPI001557CBAD|nr:hypothetical protein [Novosphingobium sp. SG751A]NOW47858.1 hypothetical protein [Novosphingobium sp. SG751A]